MDWLSQKELSEREGAVTPLIKGAAFIKDDVHVLPLSVCRAFSHSAQILGASILPHHHVLNIQKSGSSYHIETSNGEFEAKHVVIANGVWGSAFFHSLGLGESLVPVKGECISVRNDHMPLKHTLFHEHSYILPRKGRLVIGATMVENDWSETPALGGIQKLIMKAKSMLPGVEDMKLESCWAGLRPQTFDRKPFIGRHPEQEQVFFAAGHFRNGILLAPATAAMIRDLILGRRVRSDWAEAFKVDRRAPEHVRR